MLDHEAIRKAYPDVVSINDATGAFDKDVNTSLFVQIWLTAGSAFQGTTANTTWQSVTDNTKRANGNWDIHVWQTGVGMC